MTQNLRFNRRAKNKTLLRNSKTANLFSLTSNKYPLQPNLNNFVPAKFLSNFVMRNDINSYAIFSSTYQGSTILPMIEPQEHLVRAPII
jgi:hypothetical protein